MRCRELVLEAWGTDLEMRRKSCDGFGVKSDTAVVKITEIHEKSRELLPLLNKNSHSSVIEIATAMLASQ